MAMPTVRYLPDELHHVSRERAARHGRNTKAEVCSILEETVLRGGRVGLGSVLTAIGGYAGLSKEEFAAIGQRDAALGRPHGLEYYR